MRKKHVPRSHERDLALPQGVEVAARAAEPRGAHDARRPAAGRELQRADRAHAAPARREPRRRRLAVVRHAEALAGDAVAGFQQPLLDVVGRRGVARRPGGAVAAVLGRDVLERAQMGGEAAGPRRGVRPARLGRRVVATEIEERDERRSPSRPATTAARAPRDKDAPAGSDLRKLGADALADGQPGGRGRRSPPDRRPRPRRPLRCPRRPPICRRRCSSRPPTRCPGGPPSTRRPGRRCCSRGSCWPVRRRPATSRARRAGRGGPEPVRPRRVARTGYRVAARRACRSAARTRSARTRVRPRGACARGR